MNKFNYLKSFNLEYIEELFERYQSNPSSIDESWQYFFDGLELGKEGLSPTPNPPQKQNGNGTTNGHAKNSLDLSSEAKVATLINAYRGRGQLQANIDPLGAPRTSHPLLDLSAFELTESDLSREFTAGKLIGMGRSTLSDIIQRLREIYCSSIGVEFTHIQDPITREWIQNKMEASRSRESLTPETKKQILKRLTESEVFENFIHTRYVAQKRFSLEGAEALIPALDRIIDVGAELGADNVVMGMAHRGRLNVLANIYGKKPELIFTEFEENYDNDFKGTQGDVKYHKGFSADIITQSNKPVHLSLAHNPSHLEFVNPVVEGVARAKQKDLKDHERNRVIPILIHGDAAFAGQGVVYETLNLSQLKGYWTGGTIHVVIDNQIGFTTSPGDSRSTFYSTDVAKMLEVPIFHVNGDDPEAVWYVTRLATEYRQKFKKDVFIDLICYRKYGHNEGDEPAFTQPLLYQKIKSHLGPRKIYADKLTKESVIQGDEAEGLINDVIENLTRAQEITRTEKPKPFSSSYASKWKSYRPCTDAEIFEPMHTQVETEKLLEYAKKLYEVPEGFNIHPKLKRLVDQRKKLVETGEGIDWGTGETLAYASLVAEGYPIRISGQDVERGTFSHRHAVWNDFKDGKTHTALNHISENQEQFYIFNSSLSEAGVLGFEYGWSLADPDALVIWEAQFGDFANSGQVIIDQFIASAESKWRRASGLVLLLPHGYEGQGPEHSSARLERFLQLCGQNNLAVCNFTTPAQIFHALRRQLKRDF